MSIKVEEKLICEMLSIVFNLQYLSQNFIKFKDQGQFWNPHDEQIPKLSLGVQFDQEIMEKTWETSCCKLTDHYCIILQQVYYTLVLDMVQLTQISYIHIQDRKGGV